jgi:hypothetical protein
MIPLVVYTSEAPPLPFAYLNAMPLRGFSPTTSHTHLFTTRINQITNIANMSSDPRFVLSPAR